VKPVRVVIDPEKISLPDATPADFGWVTDRWVYSSIKDACTKLPHPSDPPESREILEAGLKYRAKQLWDRVYCRIARHDGAIVGFAILSEDACHYVYVVPQYRRQGVGRELLKDITPSPWFFTCTSPMGWAFVKALVRSGAAEAKYDRWKIDRILAEE
jgi:GNAT superfamily N-acetyltransferase